MASKNPKTNSKPSKPSSPNSKPNSPSKPQAVKSKPSSSSSSSSSTASILIPSLGHVFLPSYVDILEIGKILSKGKAPEWNGKVLEVDMYSDTPDTLLAEEFPTILLKNTYLVWTPRSLSKGGSGFNRDLKCQKGGYWYPSGKIQVMDGEKVVGYFRVLKFYKGGKGGIGGQVTDWCMTEFFVPEGYGNEFVICTVVFENSENMKFLKAFDQAREVLESNATSLRGTKLETDRAVSKGGKRAQAKAKESVVGSVGSSNDGCIDVGSEMASVARRTRSQSIKKGKESINEGNEGFVILEHEGGMATRSQAKKTTGTSNTLKSRDGMTTRNKKTGGTSGTVKASTRDASTRAIVPLPGHDAARLAPPPVVPVHPVQAPEVAPHVESDVERAVTRELGLSTAEREYMEDKDYYNLVRPTSDH